MIRLFTFWSCCVCKNTTCNTPRFISTALERKVNHKRFILGPNHSVLSVVSRRIMESDESDLGISCMEDQNLLNKLEQTIRDQPSRDETVETGDNINPKGKRKKQKQKNRKETSTISDDNKNTAKPNKKPRVNYFVTVRVSDPHIHSIIKEIQCDIVSQNPILEKALIPISTLHITLLVMHLNEDQLSEAVEILNGCQDDLQRIVLEEGDPKMTFEGLGHFRNKVVFGKIKKENEVLMLQQCASVIRTAFKTSNLIEEFNPEDSLNPHLTILKLSKMPFKIQRTIRKVPVEYFSSWTDCEIGVECFNEVLLCSMTDTKQDDGFYHTLCSVPITQNQVI